MESTRPIRSLIRGLDALAVLNLRNGATVSEVAQEVGLPRTTIYRILETLSHAGYAYRDPSDDRYRVTIEVRGLSDGFDDEAWVTQIARRELHELGRELVWPIALASLSGTSMVVRETTDHRSPFAIERYPAGTRLPVLTTAAGRIHLAFCPATQREALLEALARSTREDDRLARNRVEVQKLINEARAQGYAGTTRQKRVAAEMSIAVPMLIEERVLAALAVRFATSAVPARTAIERFVPKLRDCAQRIRQRFLEQQREPSSSHREPFARSAGSRE